MSEELKALKKQLLKDDRNGYDVLSAEDLEKMEAYCTVYKAFLDAGMVIGGTSPDGRLVEAVEVPGERFCLGVQFHPEFKSRPNRAHPLFKEFIAAALEQREKKAD